MKDKLLERYRIHNRVEQRNLRKKINQRLIPSLQLVSSDDRTPTTARKGFLVKRNLNFGGAKVIKPRNLFFKETISDPPKSRGQDSPQWNTSSLRPIDDLESFRSLIGPGVYNDSIHSDKSLPSFMITPENPKRPQSPESSDIGTTCCTSPTSSEFCTSDWVSSSSSCRSSPNRASATPRGRQDIVFGQWKFMKAHQNHSLRAQIHQKTSAQKRGYFTWPATTDSASCAKHIIPLKCLDHEHAKTGMYIPMTEPISPEDEVVQPLPKRLSFSEYSHNDDDMLKIENVSVRKNDLKSDDTLPQKASKDIFTYMYPHYQGTKKAYLNLKLQENNNRPCKSNLATYEICPNGHNKTAHNNETTEEPYSPSGSAINVDYIPTPLNNSPNSGPFSPVTSPSNVIIGSRVNIKDEGMFLDGSFGSDLEDLRRQNATSTPIKWK